MVSLSGALGARQEGSDSTQQTRILRKATMSPRKNRQGHLFIHSVISSFNKYLLKTYYVPGTTPGTSYTMMNKRDSKVSCSNKCMFKYRRQVGRFADLQMISNNGKGYEENKTGNNTS